MDMISHDAARLDARLHSVELKHRYAAEWLQRPGEPYACAVAVFPGPENINVSALAGQLWPNDPVVLEECQRIRSALGSAANLPTKDRWALDLYDLARDKAKTVTERLAAYRMLGDGLGFLPRAGAPSDVPGGIAAQNVMRLPAVPTADAWEAGATNQQTALIEAAQSELAGATVN